MAANGVTIVGTPNRLWSYEQQGGRLLAQSHCMEFTPSALANLLRLYFDQVQLYSHVMYVAQVPVGKLTDRVEPVSPRPLNRRIVRGLRRSTATFGREVLAPEMYERLKERVRPRRPATPTVDAGMWAEFVPAHDLASPPPGAMGLVAVCAHPTRFQPTFFSASG